MAQILIAIVWELFLQDYILVPQHLLFVTCIFLKLGRIDMATAPIESGECNQGRKIMSPILIVRQQWIQVRKLITFKPVCFTFSRCVRGGILGGIDIGGTPFTPP